MVVNRGRDGANADPSLCFVSCRPAGSGYGWQEGKKVLATILLACPLVALAPGLK